MLLTSKIFWRARDHSKMFPKLSRTSFSGIIYFSGIFEVSPIAWWKCRLDIFFLIGLDNIQNKLSSDYSLNIPFCIALSILLVNHFLGRNPYEFSIFERSNCTLLLTRLQEKKFGDVLLLKIARKCEIFLRNIDGFSISIYYIGWTLTVFRPPPS